MTREDIIRMAQEAGLTLRGHYDEPGSTPQELERFATLVAAAEREECAKVCADNALKVAAGYFRRGQNDYFGGDYFARAIRARGNT